MARMVRTNIVLDETLVARVMKLYGLATKREAVDFALRQVANLEERRRKTLALRGIGWAGDIDEIKRDRMDRL